MRRSMPLNRSCSKLKSKSVKSNRKLRLSWINSILPTDSSVVLPMRTRDGLRNVATFKNERVTMIGNALISAAFVSYIGPFSYTFRARLWKETWLPDIIDKKIPFTDGVDPLKVLATDAD